MHVLNILANKTDELKLATCVCVCVLGSSVQCFTCLMILGRGWNEQQSYSLGETEPSVRTVPVASLQYPWATIELVGVTVQTPWATMHRPVGYNPASLGYNSALVGYNAANVD